VLVTRDVGQRSTGRILVLRTHLDALAALGHEVTVAVVSPEPPAESAWSRRFPTVHVPAPRIPSIVRSAARSATGGRGTLNEALFVDRSVQRRVAEVVASRGCDVVVVDSLRLSTATARLGPQVVTVVDLDDLLSIRYRRMREQGVDEPEAVLGFAAAHVPARLRGVVARGAVALLGRESRRVAAREVAVATSATAVSLVSRDEADALTRRSGRPVTWLPPAVRIPEAAVEQSDGLVFLGGLDYLPNLQALRLHRDEVLPHLDPRDPAHVLHVVGHVPEHVRAELTVPGIVLHGYADDLAVALSRRALVAPLPAGGGVKLKVLDAMAHGLPVAGLAGAFEGLGLPAGVAVRADDGPHLARVLRDLVADPQRCRELGAAGRRFVTETFSATAATTRWRDLLADLPVRPIRAS
jgi:hypothetical protein